METPAITPDLMLITPPQSTESATPLVPPAAAPSLPLGARFDLILAALGLVLALIVLGLAHSGTPSPLPATAPADQFAAGRAMEKLVHIAAEPHATGTAANAAVRDYLVRELTTLGYAPQVQSALGTQVSKDASIGGHVHNIVVRVGGQAPGAARQKALMLAAHYDSVATGPGAADDGASVAAILETLRALKSGPALQRDLIVLFSDAEEVGLLGAQAFAAHHPWFKDVGLVLNFEYRGNSGRMLMFETSSQNGKLVEAFAAAPRATGSSLMYEVYRILPNDTDLSVFKRAGVASMNFAAMENPTVYHTQRDRPDQLDQGSLQHQGDLMLALTRQLGNTDLNDLQAENRIYFDVPGIGLVHYAASLALPLAATLAVLFAALLVQGVRGGALRAGRVIGAAILLPLTALLFALGVTLLWTGLAALHPQYATLMEVYNSALYMGAFVALTVGLFMMVQFGLRRWLAVMELATGAMLAWVVLLLLTALIMPGASYVFTWPLVALLPAYAWLISARGRTASADTRLMLLAAAAAPAVFLFAPLIRTLFIALTTQLAGVAVLLLVLLLGILYPLASLLRRRWVFPALTLVGGLGLLAAASLTSTVSPAQPRANTLFYAEDGISGKAMWLSTDAKLDSWTGPLFGANPRQRKVPELFGDRARQYWVAPAPRQHLVPPVMAVLEDRTEGKARWLTLRIKSQRNAPQLKVYGEGVEVLHATLDGAVVTEGAQKEWAMAAYNLGPEGAELKMTVSAGQPFRLRLIDRTYGLPAAAPPRHPDMVIQPLGTSDTIQSVVAVDFK